MFKVQHKTNHYPESDQAVTQQYVFSATTVQLKGQVIKKEAREGLEVYTDQKGHMTNNAVIPSDILVTTGYGSKPDLVILSRQSRTIALLELTCPLERNLSKANLFKKTSML